MRLPLLRPLRRFGLLGVLGLCLPSCDPALRLVVQNRSPHAARFSFSGRHAYGPDSTFTKILAPKGQGRTSQLVLYYGLGGWSDTTIAQITRSITALELASSTDTLVLQEGSQLRQLFQAHRQGIAKSRVVLEIR